MGVMFVTHDFGVVAEIAHRVAVMEKGVLVEQGPADQVLNRPRHPYTQRLIAAVPHRRGEERAGGGEPPVLDVRDLRKTYVIGHGWLGDRREVHAVDGVSFSVRRGETLGIVGESGSGKSTIGKCLLKLVGINGGQLLFNGQDIAAMPESRFRPMRKDIQMIFQDPFASLNPRHTVGASSAMARAPTACRRRRPRRGRANCWRWWGWSHPPSTATPISSPAASASAWASRARWRWLVLVADESVSALDVSVQAQVLELLRELQQRLRIALVFITHDLRVAAQICDAVLVMHRGKVVEHGTPSQIFDRPQHAYTKQLIAAVPGQHWDPTQARAQAA